MIILALDPALQTGFACNPPTGLVYGVWQLAGRGEEHHGNRMIRLRGQILEAHARWRFDRLAFEDASFGANNPTTQQFHNQLRGVMLMAAAELDVEARGFNPATIKKFATGFGHAKKDQMIRALETHYGIRTECSDVADAIFILELAKQEHAVKQRIPKPKAVRRRSKETRLF